MQFLGFCKKKVEKNANSFKKNDYLLKSYIKFVLNIDKILN